MEALIGKLEKICVEYNNQLSKYEALMYHTGQMNEKLDKYTETNREKIDRLYLRVEHRLEKLDERMDAVMETYKALFTQYSEEISTLNETEREAFLKVLMEGLGQYKEAFFKEILEDYRDIQEAFYKQVREETKAISNDREEVRRLVGDFGIINTGLSNRVQDLCLIVDNAMEKMNRTLEGMDERCQGLFEDFSIRANALNEEERAHFLEKLAVTMEQYQESFGMYDALLKEGQLLQERLAGQVQENVEGIRSLEQLVRQRMQRTEAVLAQISQAYEKGFEHFEKDVSVLNDREREALCVTIRTLLEEYRFSFGREIEGKAKEMNLMFQSTLLGICNTVVSQYKEYEGMLEAARAGNADLGQRMEEETQKVELLTTRLLRREEGIEKALDFLQEGYKETVLAYLRSMQEANEKAQALMQENLQKNGNEILDRFLCQLELFKNERAVYLKQMEQLVEQERTCREQLVESHGQQMTLLEQKQEKLKQQLEESQGRLWKYMTVMGAVIIVLLLCLLFTGCGEQPRVNKEVEVQTESTGRVSYQLTQVYRGTVEQVMYLKCTYKQTEEIELSFSVDQELITEVLVEKGDSVEKGDLLASVNVEAAKEKLEELKHQLALDELYLQQTIEKRDFQLEQADILFQYTFMTKEDEEALKEEKESINESFAGQIQSYEDTIYFEKQRVQEYEEYVANGQLFAPMDGIISFVRSDLEGSLSEKDSCIIRMYDPETKFYTSENVEAIAYLETDKEYTIACGLGTGLREYTVVPVNMEQWGEVLYFKLLDEDYDPNNVVSGKITLTIEQKENALYLEDDAIHSSNDGYYVYTLDENGVRRMQFIEVGLWGDGVVEIVSGLEEGDRVILK